MGQRTHGAGGKYTGNHTTLIPAAALMCRSLERATVVTRITPGFIKAGLRPVAGKRRIKVVIAGPGALKLSIRDNIAHQEIYIYVTNTDDARKVIAQSAREHHIIMQGDSP